MYSETIATYTNGCATYKFRRCLDLIWSVPLKRVFAMNSTNICPRDMGRLTHAVMEKTASDKRSIACTLFRGVQNCITERRRKWGEGRRGYNQFSFSDTR